MRLIEIMAIIIYSFLHNAVFACCIVPQLGGSEQGMNLCTYYSLCFNVKIN